MNYPVVFVPGLFGSLGKDIIPGTGDYDFGLAEYAYRPIIRNLESMGYKLGRNLFISYYNWRESNEISARKYLVQVINTAKKVSGSNKVDIVCHSMGGLVSRSYIQSDYYNYDVNKLIMIGTPNYGSVNAYYFWEGGKLPYDGFKASLFKVLWEGFIWILKKRTRSENNLEFLHKVFPSIKELLPNREYGNYLYTIDRDNFAKFMPLENMKVQNTFLNNLNRNAYLLYNRGVKVYNISGTGVNTRKYLRVIRDNTSNNWIDGKAIYDIKTPLGDGTVTYKSSSGIYGENIVINGDHDEILYKCKNELGKILNKRSIYTFSKASYNDFYSILVENAKKVNIIRDKNLLRINSNMIEGQGVIVRAIGENSYWIIVDKNIVKEINLNITPLKDMDVNIVELGEKSLAGNIVRIKKSNKYNIKF